MARHAALVAIVIILTSVALAVRQPGDKAAGPECKADGYTLVWGKMAITSDFELGDETKSRYSITFDGTLEAPADVDAVAAFKRFRIRSVTDDKGLDMTPRSASGVTDTTSYNAFHKQVAQVELPRAELPRDASHIASMVVETDVVIARKRVEATLPAVVMEDYKDLGQGISVRITSLQMSATRELTVVLGFKRTDPSVRGPFIEEVVALDPAGKDIGGGRWTYGTPFGASGIFTGKFTLSGTQNHQSFRIITVTESESKKLSFEIKMNHLDLGPAANSGTVAAAPPAKTPDVEPATPAVVTPPVKTPDPEPPAPAVVTPPAKTPPDAGPASPPPNDLKKTILNLRTANYDEVTGMENLWMPPPEFTPATDLTGKQRTVLVVGKLRYIGGDDLSGYDLKFQIVYRNKANKGIGVGELLVPGKDLKADRDYTFRQSTVLTEEYVPVIDTFKMVFVNKVKSLGGASAPLVAPGPGPRKP